MKIVHGGACMCVTDLYCIHSHEPGPEVNGKMFVVVESIVECQTDRHQYPHHKRKDHPTWNQDMNMNMNIRVEL